MGYREDSVTRLCEALAVLVHRTPSAVAGGSFFLLQLGPVLGRPHLTVGPEARLSPPLCQRPCGGEMVLSVQLTNRSRRG